MMICTQNYMCRRPLARDFFYGKCYCWSIIAWAIVFLIKCLSDQIASGQLSFWANVSLGKCLLGKCLSGQMPFWANVLLALGKRVLGKRFSG
jgi:hypothetical protein